MNALPSSLTPMLDLLVDAVARELAAELMTPDMKRPAMPGSSTRGVSRIDEHAETTPVI